MNRVLFLISLQALIMMVFFTQITCCYAQSEDEDLQNLFCRTSSTEELQQKLNEALPTPEECDKVFKHPYSHDYYAYLSDTTRKVIKRINPGVYNACEIDHFTSENVFMDDTYIAAQGMFVIQEFLRERITFYEIYFYKDDDYDYSKYCRYLVKMNERWVYFPDPWVLMHKE